MGLARAFKKAPPTAPLPTAAQLRAGVLRAIPAREPLRAAGVLIHRLLHDAADAVPGLQVDVFGPVALVQAYDPAWEPRLVEVSQLLLESGAARTVRAVVRGPSGTPSAVIPLQGEPTPPEFTAAEGPWSFQIRPLDESLGVGVFPDARGARARVAALAYGQSVLNLFAYAGGFTVAAMVGGAATVDQVDLSPKVCSWAARNLAINGVSPRRCRFLTLDALAFTAKTAKAGKRYGVVIMDPPTFARHAHGWHTTQGLGDLLGCALEVTQPSGRLLFSTNTVGQDWATLMEQVTQAAQRVGKDVVLEEVLTAGMDFPRDARHPHLERFKMLQVRVD